MQRLWVRGASSVAVAAVVLMAAAGGAYASSDATVVRTTMGTGEGFESAYATCPAGEDATGGGVGLSGASSSAFVSDSGPVNSTGTFLGTVTGSVPTQWYGTAFVQKSGNIAYVWAVCSHTSTTVVREPIASGATTGFHHGVARCPAGQQATGGGLGVKGGSATGNYEFLSDDAPLDSVGDFVNTATGTVPVQWYGTGYIDTARTTAYVWAVCSHLATTVVRKNISSGAAVGPHFGSARCPSGTRATGGGQAMNGGSGSSDYQIIADTAPTGSDGNADDTTTGTIPTQWFATSEIADTGTAAYDWAVCG